MTAEIQGAASDRPLRLAMIGGAAPSMIGPVHRIGAVMDRNFDLVAAVPSSQVEKGIAAGLSWGVTRERIHATVEALLAAEASRQDGVEALAICTPNDSHFALAEAGLRAGLDIILDKPLCNALSDALALQALAKRQDRIIGLTHAYAGYPMVRDARARVARGEIGEVRLVQVEYLGSGLAAHVESLPDATRRWRLDPAKSGPSLVLGDIGTHAHHLACFVAGRDMTAVSAEVGAIMPGRKVDDYAQIRFAMGPSVRGAMLVCQAAAGAEKDISVRVFGSKGHIAWRHRDHNHLTLALLDGEVRTYGRGQPNVTEDAKRATRIQRGGHPEGLHEAFANLYNDFADLIRARRRGARDLGLAQALPQAADGVAGLRFVEAALASSRDGGAWMPLVA